MAEGSFFPLPPLNSVLNSDKLLPLLFYSTWAIVKEIMMMGPQNPELTAL
jgi:hypothetical protein